MLKCIKASITPVSCKIKNPLQTKTKRSYDIIHKAEKQLLYERIRNFNSTLDMLENNRSQYCSHLKNMLNQHDQESDINKCILFINRIKDHRHNKIKEKEINKFKHLYFKKHGYYHNRNRQTQHFDTINCTLSGHLNVPSSFSDTSTPVNSNPTVPATPMAPTPSTDADPAPTAPSSTNNHPCYSSRDTCKNINCTNMWVINLSKTPLTMEQLSYKKALTLL